MKQHDQEQKQEIRAAARTLSEALMSLETPREARNFLEDLCTRAELEALRARTAEAVRLLADAHGMRLTATEAPPSVGFLQRYRSWIVGVVALVLGFAAGIAVIDYRIRKRYGGFRI